MSLLKIYRFVCKNHPKSFFSKIIILHRIFRQGYSLKTRVAEESTFVKEEIYNFNLWINLINLNKGASQNCKK